MNEADSEVCASLTVIHRLFHSDRPNSSTRKEAYSTKNKQKDTTGTRVFQSDAATSAKSLNDVRTFLMQGMVCVVLFWFFLLERQVGEWGLI